MAARIEDYALIGDGRTAALISREGSVDWLCWPRFDASALFASLLGTEEHGYWRLAPQAGQVETSWAYREGSLVLETDHKTREGEVRVIDYMPVGGDGSHLIRLVEGLHGRVAMRMDLAIRFDYGSAVPWVSHNELGDLRAIAGPHKAVLRTKAHLKGHGPDHGRGVHGPCRRDGRLHPQLRRQPRGRSAADRAAQGARRDRPVLARLVGPLRLQGRPGTRSLKRSLLTLKALTYAPTGGIVAAPTTSLPEELGGVRNWDYRFCWLRDATFTLYRPDGRAAIVEEARAWRDWLLRAVAGNPEQAQILYGIAGERLLPELELAWLPGYEGSKPVRVGNAAASQLQLDVYGEVIDALYQARAARPERPTRTAGALQLALMDHLERPGTSPTRASGRCAAAAGTSCTRR